MKCLWRRRRDHSAANEAIRSAEERLAEAKELSAEYAREGAKSREQLRRNHFGESLDLIYEGKKRR